VGVSYARHLIVVEYESVKLREFLAENMILKDLSE
jgi:hypothetical protein